MCISHFCKKLTLVPIHSGILSIRLRMYHSQNPAHLRSFAICSMIVIPFILILTIVWLSIHRLTILGIVRWLGYIVRVRWQWIRRWRRIRSWMVALTSTIMWQRNTSHLSHFRKLGTILRAGSCQHRLIATCTVVHFPSRNVHAVEQCMSKPYLEGVDVI